MAIYKTIQGDTWDLIAYKHYGNEMLTAPLLEANSKHLDMVIFPSGESLTIPALSEDVINASDAPPWRDDA